MAQTRKSRRSSCRSTRKMDGGKRKLSGYMKFAKMERKKILNKSPNMPFTAVGKELGKRWRSLSIKDKKHYA